MITSTSKWKNKLHKCLNNKPNHTRIKKSSNIPFHITSFLSNPSQSKKEQDWVNPKFSTPHFQPHFQDPYTLPHPAPLRLTSSTETKTHKQTRCNNPRIPQPHSQDPAHNSTSGLFHIAMEPGTLTPEFWPLAHTLENKRDVASPSPIAKLPHSQRDVKVQWTQPQPPNSQNSFGGTGPWDGRQGAATAAGTGGKGTEGKGPTWQGPGL
jgi:hypothetical protein